MDTIERARRADAFQALLDALTGETSRHLTAASAYAVDETAIESFARGKRSNKKAQDEEQAAAAGKRVSIRCWDRDARWGHKTVTSKAESGSIFGFHALTFTRARTLNGTPEPFLLERIARQPANAGPAGATFDVLGALGRAGRLPSELIVDIGFSQLAVENWAAPLAALGVKQVLDLKKTDHQRDPHVDGFVMIDGQPYCASIPEELVRINKPANLSLIKLGKHPSKEHVARAAQRQQEIDAFNTAIAHRELYRFVPHGKTAKGEQRWKCPVQAHKAVPAPTGHAPDYDAPIPTIVHPTTGLPKACAQRTIVIADDVQVKFRQEHVWGSPQWQASYARRARAEGAHGILKSIDTGAIRRGFIRYRGIVRTGLMLGLAVMATNLRSLERWLRSTGEALHPVMAIDTRGHGFVELDADGTIGGLAPPVA